MDAHNDPTTAVPDSAFVRAIREFIRDTETELLFNYASRPPLQRYRWHRALRFDPELLYAGAMFHDLGLMPSRPT